MEYYDVDEPQLYAFGYFNHAIDKLRNVKNTFWLVHDVDSWVCNNHFAEFYFDWHYIKKLMQKKDMNFEIASNEDYSAPTKLFELIDINNINIEKYFDEIYMSKEDNEVRLFIEGLEGGVLRLSKDEMDQYIKIITELYKKLKLIDVKHDYFENNFTAEDERKFALLRFEIIDNEIRVLSDRI